MALGQAAVYRIEILLTLVYGGLLLLTPLFHGVLHGRLPTELSHRGAKWPADAEKVLASVEARIAEAGREQGKLMKSKHFENRSDDELGR